jgi:hypothetical protein
VHIDIKLWDSEELEHALVDQTIHPLTGRVLRGRVRNKGPSAVQIARILLRVAGELDMSTKLLLDTRTSPEAEVRGF